MTYDDELAEVKSEAFKDGCNNEEWSKWKYQIGNALRSVGFRSGKEVRRVALKNGRFIDR